MKPYVIPCQGDTFPPLPSARLLESCLHPPCPQVLVEVLENVYERQLLALSGEAFVEEVTICGLLPGSPQELRLPDTCLGQPVEAVLTLRNASAKHFRRGCRTVNACRLCFGPFSAYLSLDLLLTLPRVHVSCSTASNVCEQGRTACKCGMRRYAWPSVPDLSFSPSSGHLQAGAHAPVTARFQASARAQLAGAAVALKLTQISYKGPALPSAWQAAALGEALVPEPEHAATAKSEVEILVKVREGYKLL